MKKLAITIAVWLVLLFFVDTVNNFFFNSLITVAADEAMIRGGPPQLNYWLLLLANSIVYMAAGITIRARIAITHIAGLSAIAFGVTYFFLVELTGGSMWQYATSHPSRLEVILTFGPLLSPLIFVPIGVYIMDYWSRHKNYE